VIALCVQQIAAACSAAVTAVVHLISKLTTWHQAIQLQALLNNGRLLVAVLMLLMAIYSSQKIIQKKCSPPSSLINRVLGNGFHSSLGSVSQFFWSKPAQLGMWHKWHGVGSALLPWRWSCGCSLRAAGGAQLRCCNSTEQSMLSTIIN
jgi:hypothetical protein